MPVSDLLSKPSTKSIQSIILHFLDQKLPKQGIEIEARIGRITSRTTNKRMNYETLHPIVFQNLPNEFEFKGEVAKEDFNKIKQILFENGSVDKFTKTESSDKISVSRNIRKIQTNETIVYQKKTKMARIDIYMPEFAYDIRISISIETDVEQKDFIQKFTRIQRNRERKSFRFNEYSFDFTKVISSKGNNKEENTREYEIEVEVKDMEFNKIEFVTMLLNLPILKIF